MKEIKIGADGSADYALVTIGLDGKVADFVALEIQACGTGGSGSVWDCRNDYLRNAIRHDYDFTLNEKDASKKILVQLLHKARQVARWRKNTVLIIQDVFLDHLKHAYNISHHFHPQDDQDFIHIHAYKVVQQAGGQLNIELAEALSTDMVGLSMALISNPANVYFAFNRVEGAIRERMVEGKSSEL